MNTTKTICYWTTTTILAAVLLTGGIADLARIPATTEGVLDLGYPLYFVTILGVWKVLGATAIVVPRFPRLKEWAYAGSFFNFTGAVISHIASDSPVYHVFITSILAVCTVVSWALRPHDRTLGVLSSSSIAAAWTTLSGRSRARPTSARVKA